MKITIEGKNIELTKALKDYVNEKLMKLQHHYNQIIKEHEIKVKLSVLRNPRIEKNNVAEVTIFLDGKIICSEETNDDMYASIDFVVDKLDRQIEKYKAKHYRSLQHKDRPDPNQLLNYPLTLEEDILNNKGKKEEKREERREKREKKNNKLIKTKKFQLHPMTPDEAVDQLDLISHDFYIFINSKTKQINTIYKRKDGDYGLIEPIV